MFLDNINWQNVFFLIVIIYSFLLGFHSFTYSNKELKVKVGWSDTLVLLLLLVAFPKGAILCFILIPLVIGTWFSRIMQKGE